MAPRTFWSTWLPTGAIAIAVAALDRGEPVVDVAAWAGMSRVELEWVDFLQFGVRQYIAGPGPAATIRPSRLGPVITHIRCSLAASDDHRHVAIPLVDGSAAFLPAGAAVFEVRGYSPRCRLASYVRDQPHVYLAQHDVHGQSVPLRCAL